VYRHSVGDSKNVEVGANKTDSRYRIGSVSKLFTAVMIFQLIDEDKLQLDTPLSAFYPKVKKAKKITIEQLLRHKSGIHSFTRDEAYMSFMNKEVSTDEMVKRIASYPSDFKPNSKLEYSNSNYYLLGKIIEKITGKHYGTVILEKICRPLLLDETYYGRTIGSHLNEIQSFKKDDSNNWELASETNMSVPHGAGALVSSTENLVEFIECLFQLKLIKKESLENMIRIQDGGGMGLFQFPMGNKIAYGHDGKIDGFNSMLAYFPESRTAISVLSNGIDMSMNDMMIGLLSIYFGAPYEIPDFGSKSVELSALEMEKFTGLFTSEQLPMEINVFLEDGELRAQATNQQPLPMTTYENNVLKFSEAGIVMEFKEIEEKKFSKFILKQGGGVFEFNRFK